MDVKKRYLLVGFLVLIAVSGPFLYAFLHSNSDWLFGGFLLNPVDGYSYLAKMQQGFKGEWKFTLLYTAEPGQGAYLFLFYIGLGQISRMLNMSLISVFHSARLLGCLFLLFALWKLVKEIFIKNESRFYAYVLIVFGSGLGWLAVLAGKFTSDFWVAEAYPFLSMYANPHFPIGLGLMILMLIPGKKELLKSLSIGLLIAIIQPFSIVILIVIFVVLLTIEITERKELTLKFLHQSKYLPKIIGLGLSGGSMLLYQYWSILSDPVLAIWNTQNQTPSPDLVDFMISFLPVIILGLFGAKSGWKTDIGKTLIIWSASSILLLLVPWNLPRRFLTGLYVPLGGLSILGLEYLTTRKGLHIRSSALILILLILPTNIIVLVSGIQAARNFDQRIYYSSDLDRCFRWINNNIELDALIMTDEHNGLLIPATTGRRVIYGHPFETADADIELDFIHDFFDSAITGSANTNSLVERRVDYILMNSRNGPIFDNDNNNQVKAIYKNAGCVLYELIIQ